MQINRQLSIHFIFVTLFCVWLLLHLSVREAQAYCMGSWTCQPLASGNKCQGGPRDGLACANAGSCRGFPCEAEDSYYPDETHSCAGSGGACLTNFNCGAGRTVANNCVFRPDPTPQPGPPVNPPPPPLRYDCENNTCVVKAGGAYESASCNNACNPSPTYGCRNGACVQGAGTLVAGCGGPGACEEEEEGWGCVGTQCVEGAGDKGPGCGGCNVPSCIPPFSDWVCCPGGGAVPAGNEQNCVGGGGGCEHDRLYYEDAMTNVRFISNENGILKAWKGTSNPTNSAGEGADQMGNYVFDPSANPPVPSERNGEDSQMKVEIQLVGDGTEPNNPYFDSARYEIDPDELGDDIKADLYDFYWWRITNPDRTIEIAEPTSAWDDLIDQSGTVVGYNVKIRQVDSTHLGYTCANYAGNYTDSNPCVRTISMIVRHPTGTIANRLGESYTFRIYRDNCGDSLEPDGRFLQPTEPWHQVWWGGFPNGTPAWRDKMEPRLSRFYNRNPDGWHVETWNNGVGAEGYWSLTFSHNTKWRGVNLYAKLIVTPPAGYECGRGFNAKVEKITGSNNCEVTEINGELVFVEFVKAEVLPYSICSVSVDGKPEVFIDTTSRTTDLGPLASINFVAYSTDINTTTDKGGRAILQLLKTDVPYASLLDPLTGDMGLSNFFSETFGSPVTKFYRPPTGLPGRGQLTYNTGCRSLNGLPCTAPIAPQSLYLGYRQAFFNTPSEGVNPRTMKPGTYYAFCYMPEGDTKCTGNPRCQHEGGTPENTTACSPARSCSEPTGAGYLEEIAMYHNNVRYRENRLNASGSVISYGEWASGPFSVNKPITSRGGGGQVLSLAMYDFENSVHVYMWTLHPKPPGTGTTWDAAPLRLNRFYVTKDVNGLVNWNRITEMIDPDGFYSPQSGGYSTGANAPLTGNRLPTAHSLILQSSGNLLEYVWFVDDAGMARYRYRNVPVNANGMAQFGSASNWVVANNLAPSGTTNQALTMGSAIVPGVPGPVLHQGYTTIVSGVAEQFRRQVQWSVQGQAANLPFNLGDQVVRRRYIDNIFDTNVAPDAYDARYSSVASSDKVKITVACLSSCDVCSTTATPNGCGGTCSNGALAGLNNPAVTIIPTPTNLLSGTNQLIAQFDRVEGASGYELVAYPLSASPPTAEADIQQEIRNRRGSGGYVRTVTQPVNVSFAQFTIDLTDPVFNGSGRSPKLRVAVRTISTCGSDDAISTTEWNYANVGTGTTPPASVRMTSNLSFTLRELAAGASCPATPTGLDVPTLTTNVSVTAGNGFGGAYSGWPTGTQPNVTVTPGNAGSNHTLGPVWFAPTIWPNTNLYSVNPNPDHLSANEYIAVCTSRRTGLRAPGDIVPVFVTRAYNPWFQARGGSVRAGSDMQSNIPLGCVTNNTTCSPFIASALSFTAGITANKTAGIPIAGGTILNRLNAGLSMDNRRHSQNTTSPDQLAAASSLSSNVSNIYSQLTRKIEDFLSLHNKSAVTISGIINDATFADFLARANPGGPIATIGGKSYYVFRSTGDITLDLPTAGWTVPANRVVIIQARNITITSQDTDGLGSPATVVPATSFLLAMAEQNITVNNRIGRAPVSISTTTSPPVSLHGIFLAGDTLTIASDGNTGRADNQFIGRGSFVGLQNVELLRSFAGTINGAAVSDTNFDLRPVNNLNPVELFIYDPSLVINTPNFLRSPILTFEEVN